MFLRDFSSVPPPLNGGMIGMVECPRNGPDASKLIDDFGMGFHKPNRVRPLRTNVNLESVQPSDAQCVMTDEPTIGQKLNDLRARADMTLDAVAEAAGYSGRSSIQRYFNRDYDANNLPFEVARKLTKALVGKGNPTILAQEVLALAGVYDAQSAVLFEPPKELEKRATLPNDIPIYGTALGGQLKVDNASGSGSTTVEQAELCTSEVLGYKRRPPALEGQDSVYGVYVAGMSMFPRFSDGEATLVDPKRPARIGDDVVVHLKGPDEHDGERVSSVLIKRLVRRNSEHVELEQFNPPLTFRVPSNQVKWIHRIVTLDDLL